MYESQNLARPHALYRMYDVDNCLIYVGCTVTPMTRIEVHHRWKSWAERVATVTIRWLPTWAEARQAEALAIMNEQPLFNRTGPDPDGVKHKQGRPPRGDGELCPTCKERKKVKGRTYCQRCAAKYHRDWRARREAALLTLKSNGG